MVSLQGGDPLLTVRDLAVDLRQRHGVVHAVRGLSYSLDKGEAMGMVGESGSGKTISSLALLGLLPAGRSRVVRGSILFAGRDIVGMQDTELRALRGGRISMVFQNPLSSLNPVMTIGRQLTEAIRLHLELSADEACRRAIEMLELVGIPNPKRRLGDYPHQFSGGMRQRVMIAMALSCRPDLIVADEPTTALDVTIQAQVLDLLNRLRHELGMAVILISHDLGVVADTTDRIAIMYAGRIVETGPTRQVLGAPRHPYTIGLLRSIPPLDGPRRRDLAAIEGAPPDLSVDITGCPFRDRCAWAIQECAEIDPPVEPVAHRHTVACWVKPAETVETT
ncbi:MAG TPA: ABC transporter ATP-binding protein [bacterium]|nr:ABC transporter ATP-binding protein [bacterium]